MGNNNSQETERSHSLGNFENRLNVPVPDSTSTSESFILHQTGLSLPEIESIFKKYIEINPQVDELNRKEFAKLYISFRSEDCDKIGKITDYIFNAFDTDRNGRISFEEFLIGYGLTTRKGLEKKLEYAFNMFDLDADGYLSTSDLKEVLPGMIFLLGCGNYNCDDLTKCCIGLMGKHCKGKINRDEFIQFLKKDYGLRSILCPFQ